MTMIVSCRSSVQQAEVVVNDAPGCHKRSKDRKLGEANDVAGCSCLACAQTSWLRRQRLLRSMSICLHLIKTTVSSLGRLLVSSQNCLATARAFSSQEVRSHEVQNELPVLLFNVSLLGPFQTRV